MTVMKLLLWLSTSFPSVEIPQTCCLSFRTEPAADVLLRCKATSCFTQFNPYAIHISVPRRPQHGVIDSFHCIRIVQLNVAVHKTDKTSVSFRLLTMTLCTVCVLHCAKDIGGVTVRDIRHKFGVLALPGIKAGKTMSRLNGASNNFYVKMKTIPAVLSDAAGSLALTVISAGCVVTLHGDMKHGAFISL